MSNNETASDTPNAAPKTPVDTVIDMLGQRRVSPKDVDRLDTAVQGAKSPLGGRAGADQGLGRAIGW